jgi:cell division protein FtsZ
MPDEEIDLRPRITVVGVGGAGGNAVNNMIEQELDGCEFVVANTDAQALSQSHAGSKIQIGTRITEGLGAGARPEIGAAAAEESIEEIVDHLSGVHMAFITAGMGGGTGTGAAPIIAQAARELGVLTVGVVTKPFQFEGAKRMRQAEQGIEQLQKMVDTLIIIPNQNLFRIANEKTTFTEAFAMADDVLYQGVRGVTDLMVRPGLINLDFADVRSVMGEMGKAMMGTGECEGESRALQAAEKAIANPLLDEISLRGARGILINITGGYDLTLFELDEAANRIREEVDPEANIIVGSTLDVSMEGKMRVGVVATGIDAGDEVAHNTHHSAPARPVQPMTRQPDPIAQKDVAPQVDTAQVTMPEPVEPAPVADPVTNEDAPLFEQFAALEDEQAYYADDPEQDIPPPAYQPEAETDHSTYVQAEPTAPAQPAVIEDTPPPRAPAPGGPSAATLEKLRAVIEKDSPRTPIRAAANNTTRQPQDTGKSRFGINTFLNRMSGHGETESGDLPHSGHSSHARHSANGSDDDRIEVPAFLRRQAN